MYAVVIFPYTKSIQVIPVQWVLNFDKNQKCAVAIIIGKPNFDKSQLKKDLQNEEEGLVHKSQHIDVVI
jgi:predicted GTPase